MKLLSKIGQIVGKVLVTWTGLEPVIRGFVKNEDTGKLEKITESLLEIRDVVIVVEQIAAASTADIPGEEKLKQATPLIADAILKSALVGDRKVKNEVLFLSGSRKMGDGMADILNSLDDDLDEDNHG